MDQKSNGKLKIGENGRGKQYYGKVVKATHHRDSTYCHILEHHIIQSGCKLTLVTFTGIAFVSEKKMNGRRNFCNRKKCTGGAPEEPNLDKIYKKNVTQNINLDFAKKHTSFRLLLLSEILNEKTFCLAEIGTVSSPRPLVAFLPKTHISTLTTLEILETNFGEDLCAVSKTKTT